MIGTQAKVALAAVALAAAAFSAWSWRGSIAEVEKEKAVNEAVSGKVKEIQEQLNTERADREKFFKAVSSSLQSIRQDVASISKVRSSTSADIAKDIADNAEFYDQPLPAVGREAWLKARSSALPASSPASP